MLMIIGIPYFTLDQVKKLFQDFQESCGMQLEFGIVERIYDITFGHPGMACFCGKVVQDRLLQTNSFLSLKDRMVYETLELRK
jgi:hypothetical protein